MSTFVGNIPKRKEVCKVTFANSGKTVECKPYANLRQLAIDNDIDLYNGLTRTLNCQGNGLCGTCTVEITPPGGVSAKAAIEKFRFLLLKGNLRMACQVQVKEDIVVTKHTGIKGNKGYKVREASDEIVQMYKDGKTLAEISEAFQVPVPKIVNIFHNKGVEMRRPGSAA
jgi:ferredoxin